MQNLGDFNFDAITAEVMQLRNTEDECMEKRRIMIGMAQHQIKMMGLQKQCINNLADLADKAAEIENRRIQSINQLSTLKTELLLSAQKMQAFQTILDQNKDLLSLQNYKMASEANSKNACLKAVEYVNTEISKCVSKCLHSVTMTVEPKEIITIAENLKKIIDKFAEKGVIIETDKEKINKNLFDIKNLQ